MARTKRAAARRRKGHGRQIQRTAAGPLSADVLRTMDAYWSAGPTRAAPTRRRTMSDQRGLVSLARAITHGH
jgi:hypothetical protein